VNTTKRFVITFQRLYQEGFLQMNHVLYLKFLTCMT